VPGLYDVLRQALVLAFIGVNAGGTIFLVVFVYFWINAVGTALGCVDKVIEIICLCSLSEAVIKSLSLM